MEGKCKRTNIEDSSQRASLDSLEKGKDATTGEAMKRGGKENPIMSHRAKALGLKTYGATGGWGGGGGGGNTITHKVHIMECSWSLR